MSTAVFRDTGDAHLYDLVVDGKVVAYDVTPDEFASILRTKRVVADEVFVEDLGGYRSRL